MTDSINGTGHTGPSEFCATKKEGLKKEGLWY